MRKVITSSVLFVLLSMFSGVAFAGKVAVCEEIKHDPAYKGLYGLCNAYWNATNEKARSRILENFYKKAGPEGPGMPGLDEPETTPVVCPCWAEGQIDIGVTPDPFGCQVIDTFAFASYDGGSIQYILGDQGPESCGFANGMIDPPEFTFLPDPFTGAPAPTAEEMAVCANELLGRIAEDFGEDCL
jgi:hypothetical protein